MSWHDCPQAESRPQVNGVDPIAMVVVSNARDLGDFKVRRALPSREKRTVGPFIFLDQMGPADFLPGHGLDVRPHPHIGLATVTYLFSGEIMHRDSLGNAQSIRPGDVNWMTAGRGIVHSERTPAEHRAGASNLFGIQAWVALPLDQEETRPDFTHHPKTALPVIEDGGLRVRLIAGTLFGKRSPVALASETIYADAEMAPGSVLPFDPSHEERAIYLVTGELDIAGQIYGAGELLIVRPGIALSLKACKPSRLMLLGGDPVDAPRYLWWNFVSSRKDRIEQAKADWKTGRFEAVTGEAEFIPLPEYPGP